MTGYVCALFMPHVSRDKGIIIGVACGAAVGFTAALVSWFWFLDFLVMSWLFLFLLDLSILPVLLGAGLTSAALTDGVLHGGQEGPRIGLMQSEFRCAPPNWSKNAHRYGRCAAATMWYICRYNCPAPRNMDFQ